MFETITDAFEAVVLLVTEHGGQAETWTLEHGRWPGPYRIMGRDRAGAIEIVRLGTTKSEARLALEGIVSVLRTIPGK